jgi:hypothetical protein
VTGSSSGIPTPSPAGFTACSRAPRSLVVRALFTCIGFVVGGLGVWLYSSADVMNLPSEGIVLVVAEKVRQPFHRMKIAFDVSSVLLAGSVCLAVLRTLGSVGRRDGRHRDPARHDGRRLHPRLGRGFEALARARKESARPA